MYLTPIIVRPCWSLVVLPLAHTNLYNAYYWTSWQSSHLETTSVLTAVVVLVCIIADT